MPAEFTTLIVEDNEADAYFVKKLLDDASRASPSLGRFSAESTRTL